MQQKDATEGLWFEVDNTDNPTRITSIRGQELPEGILYTPLDAFWRSRILTPEAVRTVTAALRWAADSRRDAEPSKMTSVQEPQRGPANDD